RHRTGAVAQRLRRRRNSIAATPRPRSAEAAGELSGVTPQQPPLLLPPPFEPMSASGGGGAAVTVSAMSVITDDAVPCAAIVYFVGPSAAELSAARLTVIMSPDIAVVGDKVAVTPVGRFVAVSCTLCGLPATVAVRI